MLPRYAPALGRERRRKPVMDRRTKLVESAADCVLQGIPRGTDRRTDSRPRWVSDVDGIIAGVDVVACALLHAWIRLQEELQHRVVSAHTEPVPAQLPVIPVACVAQRLHD